MVLNHERLQLYVKNQAPHLNIITLNHYPMRYLLSVIAASLMLMAYSCNDHKNNKVESTVVSDVRLEEMAPTADSTVDAIDVQYEKNPQIADTIALPAGRANQPQKDRPQVSTPNIDWDKKIIKTGTLTIETDNYHKYNNQIHQLVKKWEAYIAGEQENSSGYKIENVLTIKIPVQYFDEAVQQLSSSDPGKLLAKQVIAQDVTAEYFDTRARMETKKRIRLRYLDMVQKAKNMEEVLQVEREINTLQEQIEGGEGRIKYLGHSAAYSTIQLTFFQILNPKAADPEKLPFGARVLAAMTDGLWWFGELIILLFTLWPIWIGVGAIILMVRRIKKIKK